MNQTIHPPGPTIFHGDQFLEYFLVYLKNHPTCEVRIVSYLITHYKSGVIHDIFRELNNHRATCVYVGITRFVPRRSIEREVRLYQKEFKNIIFQIVFNDHRKIFYTFERSNNTSRAWVGSQNLCDSHTKNIVLECPPKDVEWVRQEIQGFNISLN